MKGLICLLLMLFSMGSGALAQNEGETTIAVEGRPGMPVEMADALHENGKIYIVVGVLLIILLGLLVYLFITDRKVSRLEKRINNQKP
jgi:hypothetical protein